MADQISSTGGIVTKPPIVIPNNFYAPDFLLDVKQEGDTQGDVGDRDASTSTPTAVLIDPAAEFDAVIVSDTDTGPPVDPAMLATPNTLTVVSQTVRFTADGRSVVDLLIDVEDVQGAVSYDVRVTK